LDAVDAGSIIYIASARARQTRFARRKKTLSPLRSTSPEQDKKQDGENRNKNDNDEVDSGDDNEYDEESSRSETAEGPRSDQDDNDSEGGGADKKKSMDSGVRGENAQEQPTNQGGRAYQQGANRHQIGN
jgi:hypothetical protein